MGDHGSSRKDTSESGIGFLSMLGRFRDPILRAFWAPRAKIPCFVRACFQVVFYTEFECESTLSELQKHWFGVRGIAKTKFSQKSEFWWFQGPVFVLFGCLGPNWGQFFWLLMPWRQAWKLMVFHGHPRIHILHQVTPIRVGSGLLTSLTIIAYQQKADRRPANQHPQD